MKNILKQRLVKILVKECRSLEKTKKMQKKKIKTNP